MNTKLILAIALLVGGIGYFFYTDLQRKNEARLEEIRRKYANQQPPEQSDDFLSWIELIIAIYGTANELWEPGGIFYGTSVPRPGTQALDDILFKIKHGIKKL